MPPAGSRARRPQSLMQAEPQHLPPKVASVEPGAQVQVPDSALRLEETLSLPHLDSSTTPLLQECPQATLSVLTFSPPTRELQCFTHTALLGTCTCTRGAVVSRLGAGTSCCP